MYQPNAAIKYRLHQEIKFLYKKKQVLYKPWQKAHLECVKTWQYVAIYDFYKSQTQIMMNTLYQNSAMKLSNLCEQNRKPHKQKNDTKNNTFYIPIQNLTPVTFHTERIEVLRLGAFGWYNKMNTLL